MRLDVYLQAQYPDITRSSLQKHIKRGDVTVNGEPQTKAGYILKENASVAFNQIESGPLESIEIPVLYEDADCVVLNKPLGVLTHSKGAFNPEATVASWLTERDNFSFEEIEGNDRSGIVHRLDRATSGVMIAAKNQKALTHLQKQFQDRKAKKSYTARIAGQIDPSEALIDLPIERNPKQPQRFRVGQNGKPSQTLYKVLQQVGDDSILELKPTTGRTHQLRVHMHYLNHPIVGDVFYEGRAADRLYLHATSLEITLPNKERQTFTAPVPEAFFNDRT